MCQGQFLFVGLSWFPSMDFGRMLLVLLNMHVVHMPPCLPCVHGLQDYQEVAGFLFRLSGMTMRSLPVPGQFVVAKFPKDQRWYRALVLSVDAATKTATITYIDFGNFQTLSYKLLKTLPQEIGLDKFPALAKPCTLHGLTIRVDKQGEASRWLERATTDKNLFVHVSHLIVLVQVGLCVRGVTTFLIL
jgi:hypothetical protein